MSLPVEDALAATRALVAAAATVEGLAADTADAVGNTALPAVFVGCPTFVFEGYCSEPSGLTFPVSVLVRLENGAVEALLGLVAAVAAALEGDTAASVSGAFPTSYDLGNQVTAAAYELTVEFPL